MEDYLKNNTIPKPGMCVNNVGGLLSDWMSIYQICRRVSLVWAVGGSEVQDFPEHLAYPIGGSKDSFRYFFVEIHYNNPDQTPSIL